MKRIAVIGAGISGLSCAWYLQREAPEAQIDVLEASNHVGGVIQTHYESPYLAELGADNIATLIPDALELVEELGLRAEFITPNPKHRFAQVVRAGRILPIPNGFSLMQPTQMDAILWSPILSWAGKLRVLSEYFIRPKAGDQDESVESFAVRRLGRECFDRLVEPIIGGIFTARAETLSMKATMDQFLRMEKEHGGLIRGALAKKRSQANTDQSARKARGARYDQFLAPRQGMGWWMNTIREHLKASVHLGVRISEIDVRPDGRWAVLGENVPNPNDGYDAVCLSTPSWVSADLLIHTAPDVAALLDRIPYASSAVAILAIPKSEIRADAMCFGVVVPKTEARDALAISLSSEKYPGRSTEDTVLARVFMGGAVRPELLDQTDEQLLQIARRETNALLGVTSLPRWQKLVRWNQAMPQYLVGHCELIQTIRDGLQQHPGVFLAGNAYEGVGIPQCIRLAKKTAQSIAQYVNR
ncbi:protoporphyrinogen oxidase [Pirellulaceae bacterium SH467]